MRSFSVGKLLRYSIISCKHSTMKKLAELVFQLSYFAQNLSLRFYIDTSSELQF